MQLGVDVSWWQGAMDWQKCEDAGTMFAFVRAGSANSNTGQPYTDYAFETKVDGNTEERKCMIICVKNEAGQ